MLNTSPMKGIPSLRTALAAFLVPMALMFSLSACGITAGYVQDKEYTEAYTSQEKVYEQRCTNAVRVVTYYVDGVAKQRMENYQDCHREWTGRYKDVYHDAEWHFDLRNDEGKESTVEVTETQYNKYEVGDYFDKEDTSAG